MPKVLVVDDQQAVRAALEILFELQGLDVALASSPAEALALVRGGDVAVVVQDMNFTRDTTSGEEGVELFRAIRAIDPAMPVLLVTAWTSLETAVMLVKEGADDYVEKPWDDHKLTLAVANLVRLRTLSLGSEERAALARTYDLCGLVYASRAMHDAVSLAVHVARSDSPVLITGSNGSGKEKLAEIIQASSSRATKPFVRVNVGALPENLMEAELFGAEAGAFTGATKLRVGRFEAADGGTLFLDEIGNLSLAGQMKLLRVLQSGDYQRLGSHVARHANVRILSATNADLRQGIIDRTFREDLYFRLNVIEVHVPRLADRRDDILPLAEAFLASLPGEPRHALGPQARDALLAYAWPGNVRELRNRLERAKLVATSHVLGVDDLGLGGEVLARPLERTASLSGPPSEDPGIDRDTLEAALVRVDGNVSRAAADLGVSRQALYRKMERLGISLQRRPRRS